MGRGHTENSVVTSMYLVVASYDVAGITRRPTHHIVSVRKYPLGAPLHDTAN